MWPPPLDEQSRQRNQTSGMHRHASPTHHRKPLDSQHAQPQLTHSTNHRVHCIVLQLQPPAAEKRGKRFRGVELAADVQTNVGEDLDVPLAAVMGSNSQLRRVWVSVFMLMRARMHAPPTDP